MHIVKVFTNSAGAYGNPVGIIEDEKHIIDQAERQKIALDSGLSEVVFIDNMKMAIVHIYSPKREIPFAGHAAVGVAYYLNKKTNKRIHHLQGINGEIDVWTENHQTWVRSLPSILPNWNFSELQSPVDVVAMNAKACKDALHTMFWSWVDKTAGIIRARTFAADWGIVEDEANGSGSMLLSQKLNRAITVQHGNGSMIFARPSKHTNFLEVGGWCNQ